MPNVITAVGALFHVLPDRETGSFLGSCFAFQDSRAVVTASHCVGNLTANELVAVWPGPLIRRATKVVKHPDADIAVLTLPPLDAPIDCFTQVVSYELLGNDFFAIGFTESVAFGEPPQPTARLYKGHYQRYFAYQSFLGYSYAAGEINIPAPGGLSGGPVFLPQNQQVLIGVVTENVNSALVLDSIEETSDNGTEYKSLNQAIVRFGITLMLEPVTDWFQRETTIAAG